MKSFAIFSVQPKILTIEAHGIHKTTSIDQATLVPESEPPSNTFQRFLVEKERSSEDKANEQNIQTQVTEYAVDQIVSHKGSRYDLHYRVYRYRYLPENNTLQPAEHFL